MPLSEIFITAAVLFWGIALNSCSRYSLFDTAELCTRSSYSEKAGIRFLLGIVLLNILPFILTYCGYQYLTRVVDINVFNCGFALLSASSLLGIPRVAHGVVYGYDLFNQHQFEGLKKNFIGKSDDWLDCPAYHTIPGLLQLGFGVVFGALAGIT